MVRAVAALTGREPLPVETSIKTCAALGALLAVSGLAGSSWWVVVLALGILAGAARSWFGSNADRPYLFAMGVLLVAAALWYPLYMRQVLLAPRGDDARFGHAPGVLALGMAFGMRLVIDAWQYRDDASAAAQRAGVVGLAVGGALDCAALYMMFKYF
jgi:hypothetical protein